MKNNLRRLNRIVKLFPENAFYTCSITDYGVTLQGKFNPQIILKAQELRFTGLIMANGYMQWIRGCYSITLTD